MKRNFYLLAFLFFANLTANASSLYMRFIRPANYTVSIDGMYYRVNGNNLRVPYLGPGVHTIRIESMARVRGPYHRAMPVVIFNGPLRVGPNSDVFASVDHRGFHVDRVVSHRYNNRRQHYHYKFNENTNRYDELDDDDAVNDRDYYDNYRGRYNYDDNNNGNADYRDHNAGDNYNRYMTTRDFDALKQSVATASFESTKRTIAMSGISQNTLSIAQLKEILGLFSLESTKLEVAKYAYDYSKDKDRFYELSDAFTFDSSKNEIARLGARR
jgi:hypothetical protein